MGRQELREAEPLFRVTKLLRQVCLNLPNTTDLGEQGEQQGKRMEVGRVKGERKGGGREEGEQQGMSG